MLDVGTVVLQSTGQELNHLVQIVDVRILLDEMPRESVYFFNEFCHAFIYRIAVVVFFMFPLLVVCLHKLLAFTMQRSPFFIE